MLRQEGISISDYINFMNALKKTCRIAKDLYLNKKKKINWINLLSPKKLFNRIKCYFFISFHNIRRNLPTAVNDRKSCDYFSSERIAVYTCIVGNYDKIQEPIFVPNNCDFFVVTDMNIEISSVWKKINVKQFCDTEKLGPVLTNRYFKFFPQILFPKYKYSIYIDGNFRVYSDLTEHINRINSKTGVALFQHPNRDCVFSEIDTCLAINKGNSKQLKKYKNFLINFNFPKKFGLAACGFIARDHNNPVCRRLMNQWWEEFQLSAERDQICFPYVLYINNLRMADVVTLGGNIYDDDSFMIVNHG